MKKIFSIEGLYSFQLPFFEDNRGGFQKLFSSKIQAEIGQKITIEQINFSFNKLKGTFRGLHFQYPPFTEIKYVYVLSGAITDIIVDLRKGSPTFLQHQMVPLSTKGDNVVIIPEGCAHGFQTMADDTRLLYLHSQKYVPDNEGAISFNDPRLGIQLPISITTISERDRNHSFLTEEFEGLSI